MASLDRRTTNSGPRYKVYWDRPRHIIRAGGKRKASVTLLREVEATWAMQKIAELKHELTGDELFDLVCQHFNLKREQTFREYADDWFEKSRHSGSDQYWRDNRTKLNDIYQHFGETPLSEVSAEQIDSFIKDEIRGRRGRAFGTCDLYFQLISQVFLKAYKTAAVRVNPVAFCHWKKKQTDHKNVQDGSPSEKYFTPAEYRTFITFLAKESAEHVIFVDFLVMTGVRFSEAASIRVTDLWPNKNLGEINQIRKKKIAGLPQKIGFPKPDKTHVIEIPDSLTKRLRVHCEGKRPEDLVFTNFGGKPLDNSNFRVRHWDKAMIKASQCPDHLPLRRDGRNGKMVHDPKNPSTCECLGDVKWTKYTPHNLRHTFATWAIELLHLPVPYVSKQLSHGNSGITEKYYDHQIRRGRQNVIGPAIDKLFDELAK